MFLNSKATLAILKYVVNAIDLKTSQIFRESGDGLQVKCFFLLVDDYVKESPHDPDLNFFNFENFTTSILRAESSDIKHRTLADIATQAMSRLSVSSKKTSKWISKLTENALCVVGDDCAESWGKTLAYTNIITAFKSIDQVDQDLVLVLKYLFGLAEPLFTGYPESESLKRGIVKIMLGPCLKNFVFNDNEKAFKKTAKENILALHSKLYNLFSMVALSLLEESKLFSLLSEADYTDEQICSFVFEGISEPLENYFRHHPEKVNTIKGIIDRSLLHIAAMRGHVDLVKLLLSHNANIDAVDRLGIKPLEFAIKNSKHACVKLLEDARCEIESYETSPGSVSRSHQSFF